MGGYRRITLRITYKLEILDETPEKKPLNISRSSVRRAREPSQATILFTWNKSTFVFRSEPLVRSDDVVDGTFVLSFRPGVLSLLHVRDGLLCSDTSSAANVA